MVVPHDDPSISMDETLIRRINPAQHIVSDDNRGCRRVSSKAVSPSSEPNGGMSVDVLGLMVAANVDAGQYVTTPTFIGSIAFNVRAVRAVGLWVGYDPIIGNPGMPDNPYHGEVWGNDRPNRFSKAQKHALLVAAKWFVKIDGVEILP